METTTLTSDYPRHARQEAASTTKLLIHRDCDLTWIGTIVATGSHSHDLPITIHCSEDRLGSWTVKMASIVWKIRDPPWQCDLRVNSPSSGPNFCVNGEGGTSCPFEI